MFRGVLLYFQTVRRAYVKSVDENWEKRRSPKGSVWYHNALLKVTTWDEPTQYWDPDRDCEWDRDRGCEIPFVLDW